MKQPCCCSCRDLLKIRPATWSRFSPWLYHLNVTQSKALFQRFLVEALRTNAALKWISLRSTRKTTGGQPVVMINRAVNNAPKQSDYVSTHLISPDRTWHPLCVTMRLHFCAAQSSPSTRGPADHLIQNHQITAKWRSKWNHSLPSIPKIRFGKKQEGHAMSCIYCMQINSQCSMPSCSLRPIWKHWRPTSCTNPMNWSSFCSRVYPRSQLLLVASSGPVGPNPAMGHSTNSTPRPLWIPAGCRARTLSVIV